MVKISKIIKCPLCGREGVITAENVIAFNGMLEDLDGYYTAKFKCPHCGYENEISDCNTSNSDDKEHLNQLVNVLETKMKNANYEGINPIVVGVMLLDELSKTKRNLTLDYVKSKIRSI